MNKDRVLSGMRPTGPLHYGHLCGALWNWIEMQKEYDCFYFVADYHALSSEYDDPAQLSKYTMANVTDWLAAGVDPKNSTLFVQSWIPQHSELFTIFAMITPLGWLERVPTYKEQQQQLKNKDLSTYGFLGYPCLQAADIMIYKAKWVPVGEDQVAHVELTREIVRRFNNIFKVNVFPEPKAKLTEAPRLLGIDGRKMSKSYGNAINLNDSPDEVKKKLAVMYTDPARLRRKDPGNPDICNVYTFHKQFSPQEDVQMVNRECRVAGIGCVECKNLLFKNMVAKMEPFWEKQRYYLDRQDEVRDVLKEGSLKAREVATQTMDEVSAAIKVAERPKVLKIK